MKLFAIVAVCLVSLAACSSEPQQRGVGTVSAVWQRANSTYGVCVVDFQVNGDPVIYRDRGSAGAGNFLACSRLEQGQDIPVLITDTDIKVDWTRLT